MSVIQHWLGHSLITATESIYAHFDAEMLKPALKNVNQILSGREGQGDTIDEAPNRPLKIDALS